MKLGANTLGSRDLKQRLLQHNSDSTKTTKNRGEFKLIWYCAFNDKLRAYEFERYLKSSSGHAFANKRLI